MRTERAVTERKAPRRSPARPAQLPEPKSPCGRDGRKPRVLVADDEEDTRLLLRVLLESRGWEVLEARDGQEAFEMIIDEMPDVALVDNRMPSRTGADVYRSIRRGSILIPVVLMTAASRASEVAMSLGLRYFLPKPFDAKHVLDVLEKACAEGGARLPAR